MERVRLLFLVVVSHFTHPILGAGSLMTKICSACKKRKPRSEFHRRGDRGPLSVVPRCKPCCASAHRKYMESEVAKARDRELHNAAYANDPEVRAKVTARTKKNAPAQRAATLKRQYGLTQVQWDAKLAVQGGVCAICKGAQSKGRKSFCTDHDHKTGTVRGLLCHPCNVAIGLLRDSADLAFAAACYLRQHKS